MSYFSQRLRLADLPALNKDLGLRIRENESILRKAIDQSISLNGLGRITKQTLSFDEVVTKYNEGITELEIKAWVWYKRSQGVPMNGWERYYTKKTGYYAIDELTEMVNQGVLFFNNGELLPLPIFTYGNMYDRELMLEANKEKIISTYSEVVFNNHLRVIHAAKPELLSVTAPDPTERPIITAISDFATDANLFTISTVREEYLNVDSTRELKRVNGRTVTKKDKEVIHIKLSGDEQYTLQTVFKKWLFALNSDTDFEKSNPIDIDSYYLEGRALRDDKLTKEEKSELKANARIEGEALFSRFLHEVLTFEDQKRLDYAWNRVYNAQSDINYAKVPIGFTASNRFKSGLLQITPIQRQGVAFMEAMGSGINAFDVGVGKTMTAIVNLAHNLHCGKCKRPLVVVPKPTYKKWMSEIIGYTDRKTGEFIPGVLSGTGITVNDWFNLCNNSTKKSDFAKPVPEKSITLVTYEGFKRIGFGESVLKISS